MLKFLAQVACGVRRGQARFFLIHAAGETNTAHITQLALALALAINLRQRIIVLVGQCEAFGAAEAEGLVAGEATRSSR